MIVGCDLALIHGALVTSEGELLFAYTGRKGMAVTSEELYDLAQELILHTPSKSTLVIDFDRRAGFWGGGRSPEVAVLITQLVSFYGAMAQGKRNCSVYYVTPGLVRYCLGLPPMCSKSDVHEHARNHGIIPSTLPNDIEGDNHDAFLLCYTFQCALKNSE